MGKQPAGRLELVELFQQRSRRFGYRRIDTVPSVDAFSDDSQIIAFRCQHISFLSQLLQFSALFLQHDLAGVHHLLLKGQQIVLQVLFPILRIP